MKKSRFSTLLGAISCLTAFGSPAKAGSFFSSDSKHGLLHQFSTRYVYADYDKFEWLSSDDQPQSSVNRIVVSLTDQRLYAYHDRSLLAWSNVSSGRSGHETPTGSYTVSEKDVDHHSSLYENAPMPFFMRLTDDGLGLHGGFLPGYPASHGCVRLPVAMAKELYQRVDSGTPVVITSDTVKMAKPDAKPPVTLSKL